RLHRRPPGGRVEQSCSSSRTRERSQGWLRRSYPGGYGVEGGCQAEKRGMAAAPTLARERKVRTQVGGGMARAVRHAHLLSDWCLGRRSDARETGGPSHRKGR